MVVISRIEDEQEHATPPFDESIAGCIAADERQWFNWR
jgi:hypothetical protein